MFELRNHIPSLWEQPEAVAFKRLNTFSVQSYPGFNVFINLSTLTKRRNKRWKKCSQTSVYTSFRRFSSGITHRYAHQFRCFIFNGDKLSIKFLPAFKWKQNDFQPKYSWRETTVINSRLTSTLYYPGNTQHWILQNYYIELVIICQMKACFIAVLLLNSTNHRY